jgi:hypothetical protein
MRPVDVAGDALRLGRDALALARVALAAHDSSDVEEIRCPIEDVMARLRVLAALSPSDAASLQKVIDGLAYVLVELGERTVGRGVKI